MRLPLLHFVFAARLLLGFAAVTSTLNAATPAGFKEIFNGHDLTGWSGNPTFWFVRDGAITGQTTADKQLEGNTFLLWKDGAPGNFELRLSFRLTGQNDKSFGNSGVQYRSKLIDPVAFVVGGYQADMDLVGKYTGMLYEERGRGILMVPGEKIRVTAAAAGTKKPTVEKLAVVSTTEAILAAYKIGEWNEFVILAEGNHLRHYLNGILTADVTDDDPALAPHDGVLALQLHKGPPMTIEFKNVMLKTLP
jgi:Domain of Unknown Function (DUF1080)